MHPTHLHTALNLDAIRAGLALSAPDFDPLAAQERMAPSPRPLFPPTGQLPRLAAVVMLLYPVLTPGGIALYMPLIRRAEYPGVHSGQIGLPGGRLEDGEGFLEAALRECHEEIGVAPAAVEIIGELATLYVPPSNFEIHPFVGYVPFRPTWQPDPTEVAEVIEMPVSRLMDDGAKGEEVIARAEVAFHIHYYMVGAHKVWGATAIMLGELESRLRHALG